MFWFSYIVMSLTRMPQTRESSSRVGTMLNTRAERTKLMPRDPRSIVLLSAPVCRSRWNPAVAPIFVPTLPRHRPTAGSRHVGRV